MSKKSTNTKDPVWVVLTELGLRRSLKSHQFWTRLSKRFPKEADEFLSVIQAREAGIPEDPYAKKNVTLEFANAVASHFDVNRLYNFLVWLTKEIEPSHGAKILDVGCDNGLLMCALARIYPSIEVTGIDCEEKSVEVARQRVDQLNLSNAFVEHVDIAEFENAHEGGVDIIITSNVMHELFASNSAAVDSLTIGTVDDGAFNYKDVWESVRIETSKIKALQKISQLLQVGGVYISLDRWATFDKYAMWTKALEETNFQISINHSYILEYDGPNDTKEKMPITVAFRPLEHRLSPEEALSVFSYNRFLNATGVLRYEDANAAEIVFSALNAEDFLNIKITYKDGSGDMIMRQGIAGALAYQLITTSRGYRKLSIAPTSCCSELFSEMEMFLSQVRPHTEIVGWADIGTLGRYSLDTDIFDELHQVDL